MKLGAKWAEPE